MRAIPEGELIEFSRTTLFIEDLREIESAFRNACERVVVTMPGFELASVDDLLESNEKVLRKLTFQGHDPYVRLEFRRFVTDIYLSDRRDTTQRGIESLVRSVLSRHQTFLTPERLLVWAAFMAALGYLGVLLVRGMWGVIALVALSVVAVALSIVSFWLRMRGHSAIYPQLAASRVGFWTRNRDQLVVGLIGALVGAAATLLGTVAFGLFLSQPR